MPIDTLLIACDNHMQLCLSVIRSELVSKVVILTSRPREAKNRNLKPPSTVLFKQSDISHKTLDATRECMNRNVVVLKYCRMQEIKANQQEPRLLDIVTQGEQERE